MYSQDEKNVETMRHTRVFVFDTVGSLVAKTKKRRTVWFFLNGQPKVHYYSVSDARQFDYCPRKGQ